MKKFLGVMILLTALIVCGCSTESFSVSNVNGEIHVEGKTCDGSNGTADIDAGGGALIGEAKIESGRIEIDINGKIQTFDKSGEISVNVPATADKIIFTGRDNFTGELKLKLVPKV